MATNQTKTSPESYTVPEIAAILKVSTRRAYTLCNETTDFKVLRFGKNIRVNKDSFDKWFRE